MFLPFGGIPSGLVTTIYSGYSWIKPITSPSRNSPGSCKINNSEIPYYAARDVLSNEGWCFPRFFLHDDRWDEEQNVENLHKNHISHGIGTLVVSNPLVKMLHDVVRGIWISIKKRNDVPTCLISILDNKFTHTSSFRH